MKKLAAALAIACAVTLAVWPAGPFAFRAAGPGPARPRRPRSPCPAERAPRIHHEPHMRVPRLIGRDVAGRRATGAREQRNRRVDADHYQHRRAGRNRPDRGRRTVPETQLSSSPDRNLHVLDVRPDGALTVTTVFAQESREGRLKAVHSRIPDSSQYYGDCSFTRR